MAKPITHLSQWHVLLALRCFGSRLRVLATSRDPLQKPLRKRHGILIVDTGALGSACDMIADMALADGISAAPSWRGNSQSGLLLTYTADNSHLQRRAAAYVDRLLKGVKPQELPVEQASQFELVVNLKVARKLGVTIPQSVLLRAHQVID